MLLSDCIKAVVCVVSYLDHPINLGILYETFKSNQGHSLYYYTLLFETRIHDQTDPITAKVVYTSLSFVFTQDFVCLQISQMEMAQERRLDIAPFSATRMRETFAARL